MQTNILPRYDMSDNPTHCCPRFKPDGWDDQQLHFKDKLFVKVKTRSILYIPLNMARVFSSTISAIENANAMSDDQFMVLSYDVSPWSAEHYFSVSKEVPGLQMEHMTGDFLTRVFEGPYKNVSQWEKKMQEFVQAKGMKAKKTYFFYTTCPRCAKYYGKNYVVAVTEV